MPDALASFPSQSVGNVFLSAVDLAAALAPVPWLHPAAQLVGRIVLLCQNVPKNKYGNRFLNDPYIDVFLYRHAARQLGRRCQGLLLDIEAKSGRADPDRIQLIQSQLKE